MFRDCPCIWSAPSSGIISGIVGGLVIGIISNSHVSVSGPAAGLAAILLSAINSLGNFELVLTAGLIAGSIQLGLGLLRAGSISNYFPNNVIEGMLAGIGVIIVLKQIPHALGYDKDFEGNLQIFDGFNLHLYLGSLSQAMTLGSIVVSLFSLAILIVWEKWSYIKKIKLLPGALVAVILSIGFNEMVKGSLLEIPKEHLVNLPVPQNVKDITNLITLPHFSGLLDPKVWMVGITIAIVASIETLLCIEAADRLDPQKRITDTNLELKAQGIGNVISSLIGGLPMTSVVVRTSANINAGATSKHSAIIHGVLLLLCAVSIPFILNKIPLATLAAVLILVGFKLASPQKIKHFWAKGKFQWIPFLATVIAVVALDLLKGVALGLAISILFLLLGNMKRAYYLSKEQLEDADEITLNLAEEVSFLNKAAIKKTLKNIKPNSKLIINAQKTSYISDDIVEMIEDFANIRAREENITVVLKGFKKTYQDYEKDQHSHITITHRRTL